MTGRRRIPLALQAGSGQSPVLPTQAPSQVFDPAYQAHQLRVAGHTWHDIARATKYASGGVAQMAVAAYLQRAAAATSAEMRQVALQTELDRLEALHAAHWPKAIQGDIPASNMVLKAAGLRIKIQGLDTLRTGADSTEDIFVIAGSEEEFVAQLQAIDSGDPEAIRRHWG